MQIHSTVVAIDSTRIILLLLLAGCSHAEIPYELARVKPLPDTVHPYKVAMIPLADDRVTGDGPDADVFQYRGIEYAATDLGDLRGDVRHRITELVAAHLAKARLFAQVILVLDKSQAPEADLVLSGRIYRMRGYVEAAAPDPRSGRDPDQRMVLSEVIIKDLVLSDARNPERELLKIDAGWSTHEPRAVGPTPWTVLAETLFVALDRAAEEIARADFSGKYDVRARVGLELARTSSTSAVFGELESGAPHGWKFVETSSASSPIGWRGEKRCREAQLEQQQALRFHRALGPYRPTVWLWSCPDDASYVFDGRVEFPSVYLGDREGGRRYFVHTLGETNWPNATAELTQHLGIVPPGQKYVFELKAKKKRK
jgi:hypothetical protein